MVDLKQFNRTVREFKDNVKRKMSAYNHLSKRFVENTRRRLVSENHKNLSTNSVNFFTVNNKPQNRQSLITNLRWSYHGLTSMSNVRRKKSKFLLNAPNKFYRFPINLGRALKFHNLWTWLVLWTSTIGTSW